MAIAEPNKRRVSYVIPPPPQTHPAPLLDLPPFGTHPGSRSYPLITPKAATNGTHGGAETPRFASRNPFAPPPAAHAALSPTPTPPSHPRHRLGISTLALDTTTVIQPNAAPEGILYTGGRDGLVASWELHVPHTKRRGRRYRPVAGMGTGARVRWERIGDGGEDWDGGEEQEVEEHESADSSSEDDGADAPAMDSNGSGGRRKVVPFEDRWEVDAGTKVVPPAPSSFRQSVQTHTDWVNAMVLCNMNQTVITASSDRTIRAWSPHAEATGGDDGEGDLAVPALIGHHTDYVRSLAFARQPGVLFSGALDRDISVWDIANPRPNDPVLKVRLSDIDDHGSSGIEGEWGSIYALGVDPAGHTLAAGTPERVVRLWDPRAGDHAVTKLVGHTDVVRSILLSDDGRYMLTGSSDTTVKLWSVGEHRCLHTFNHHTSSVWALHSNHPNLERFYSGSRDGNLCVVDVEQVGDMSEGECVVLAREGASGGAGRYESKTGDEAIRSITAMDDQYVWTATASSNVQRWRDVGRRVTRLDTEFDGASYGALTGPTGGAGELPQSLGAAFEPTSIIDSGTPKEEGLRRVDSQDSRTISFAPNPAPATPVTASGAAAGGPGSAPGSPASALPASVRDRLNLRHRTTLSGASFANSVMSDASTTQDEQLLNGIPYESLVCLGLPDSPYSFGFSGAGHSTASLSSAIRARTFDERSPHDSPEATTNERPVAPHVAARRAFQDRDVAADARPLRTEPDAVIAGSPGLIRSLVLNDRLHVLTLDTTGEVAVWHLVRGECLGRFSKAEVAEALELERGTTDVTAEIKLHPQEVLELVQRRIEGENQVLPWCQVDTKVGQITVHLEGDRVFAAEILPEEMGVEEAAVGEDVKVLNVGKTVLGNLFRGLIKAEELEVTSAVSSSPTSAAGSLPSISRSPVHSMTMSMSPRHRQRALSSTSMGGGITPSINITGLATRAERAAIRPDGAVLGQSAPATTGWLSLPAAMASRTPVGAVTPLTAASGISSNDYFSLRKIPEVSPTRDANAAQANPATPTGTTVPTPTTKKKSGFMGFGKKKAAEATATTAAMTTVVESKRESQTAEGAGPKLSEREKSQLLFLDALRNRAFRPPSSGDAPVISPPDSTSVLISEQAHADGAYIVTYRSQVSSTERDMEPLEMNSPFWLLNYLFTSTTPEERRPPKIPLILLPLGETVGSGAPGSTGLKVQASRTARVRGVMEHLQGVLAREHTTRDRAVSDASALSGVSGIEDRPRAERDKPEDVVELLCGEHVADPDMKVATLKAYHWRGGVDMVLHYRVKKPVNGV